VIVGVVPRLNVVIPLAILDRGDFFATRLGRHRFVLGRTGTWACIPRSQGVGFMNEIVFSVSLTSYHDQAISTALEVQENDWVCFLIFK
jgi:hypothetical protein